MGALKLGIAAGVAYTYGGSLGIAAARAVKADISADGVTGAAWAGRIAGFVLLTALLSRV